MERKRIRFTWLLVMVMTFTLILAVNISRAAGNTISTDYKLVTIEKGDTLWNVVKDNCSNYKDIRKVLYDIEKENNLSSASISPGVKIKIPGQYLR